MDTDFLPEFLGVGVTFVDAFDEYGARWCAYFRESHIHYFSLDFMAALHDWLARLAGIIGPLCGPLCPGNV